MRLPRLFGTFRGWFRKTIRAKFDAAQTNSSNENHWAWADLLSARAALSPAIRAILRKRSRYEAANNSWYAGILRTAANHIAGCGPRLQVLTDNDEVNSRIERAWIRWSRAVNLAEKLRMIVETDWRDGEVFVMRRNRPRLSPIPLDLMVIEADQVANPFVGSPLDPSVEDGIRIDPATNEIEFYVYDHHPGDVIYSPILKGEWYPAREVLHLFRADRPGQVRGLPRATPALPLIPVMRRHTLATLFAAESAANQAVFMKTTSANITPTQSPQDFAEIEYSRNMMTVLPEGWDPFQMRPEHPTTNHEMFQRQTLMEAFRCTNMPYGLLCGTSKDSNLSSFRGDIKNTWQPEVRSEQDRLELSIVEPIFRWFLEEAIFAPGILDEAPPISAIEHRWVWPPLPNLDELDAANAATARIASGQSSLSQEHAARGQDLETEFARAAADFGVPIETYKSAVFGKLFSVPATSSVAPQDSTENTNQTASGEYTELGQRAFNNNMNRVRKILDDLSIGAMSRVLAEQTLQSIGLSPDRVNALVEDALSGEVTDEELAEAVP